MESMNKRIEAVEREIEELEKAKKARKAKKKARRDGDADQPHEAIRAQSNLDNTPETDQPHVPFVVRAAPRPAG
jgi:hypothetical protein